MLGKEHADTLASEQMLAELGASLGSATQELRLRAEASLVLTAVHADQGSSSWSGIDGLGGWA